MAVSSAARLTQTARAFDAVAHGYHRSNTDNPILSGMRARVIAMVRSQVQPGSRVIDLGCGPGTDHAALVQAGYSVTGIDLSPEMVRAARTRAAAAGQTDRVTIEQRAIEYVGALGSGLFDAAVSNFGALNCVPDLCAAAAGIHRVLRPGGLLVASVIGRLCPWETVLFTARGELSRASIRWRKAVVPVPLLDGTVWTRYVSPRQFTRDFASAGFICEVMRGLAVCAPPPYLEAFGKRHPVLLDRLFALDDRIGGWPLIRAAGDHFLVVMRRD